jgi:putative component of membrane protein insertase Oxa1/YidC/SpoIIIJ protein YidD
MQQRRLAARAIRRIERYRGSSLAGRSACRFAPTCSHYAEEALLTRRLPLAMLLIVWRLLRCNPFMHNRIADPVRRSRRWRLRPNTIPTVFAILALSGFVVVVTDGIAEAVGVSNGCTATINTAPVEKLDFNNALVVHKGESVHFIGTVPPSVQGVPKSQLTSNTHIDVELVKDVFKVTSSDHPGHGPIWGGDQNVDKYLKYGVGVYHVIGRADGSPGWSCSGDAYVELRDGNPLTKPVGEAAGGLTLIGLLGAAYASKAPAPDAPSGAVIATNEDDADNEDMASDMIATGDSYWASIGCLILIVIAIGAAFVGGGFGAAAIGGPGLSRPRTGRVWSHGHPILGFISGLLMGIGITVLLQQFAVWPLTIVTAIVFPIVIAVICALRAWLGKAYKLGRA